MNVNVTALIVFADLWAREDETGVNRSGDHTDPWSMDRLTHWDSRARVRLLGSIRLRNMVHLHVDRDDAKGSSTIPFREVF